MPQDEQEHAPKKTFHELRLAHRLNITDLARRAGVHYQTARRADSGLPMNERELLKLCAALGVELADVAGVRIARFERVSARA